MNRKTFNTFVALWALIAFSANVTIAHDETPGPPQKQPIAIVGATVHPISGPAIENGTILFDRGKIVAVGAKVTMPKNVKVIDAKGKHVYPSLFESHSQMGLIEIGAVAATDDRREIGNLNPNVKAQVAVNPDSEVIPVTRSNGVLLALSAPSGRLVAGKSAVIQLDGWTYEDMTVKAVAAMNITWPRVNSAIPFSGSTRSRRDSSSDSSDPLSELKTLFADTRAYIKAKQDPATRHDLRLEAMIPVVKGKLPIMISADQLDQIQSAVAFCVQEKARMILLGGYDAPLCADLLKKHQIPVILSSVYRLPSRRNEAYDAAYTLPAKLQKLGIQYCICGTDRSETWNARILPDHAATAVAYGLDPAEALKAITLYPAQILGVDNRVGSLDKGKDATLFVSDKSPLEITNQVEMAFVQGRAVELNDRHKRLYNKYQKKYEPNK